ncbi:MAG TPA: arylsulfotransferase family protein, partial [Minicystis sp.]|nr:arylsulfotransferase family protein [Minicystis sp.]
RSPGSRLRNAAVIGSATLAAVALVVFAVRLKQRRGDDGGAAHHAAAGQGQEPLPYINYAPVRPEQRGKAGTTTYLKDKAFRGYNLYVPKPDSAALLVDMQGEIVHRWSSKEGLAPHPLDRWRGWFTVRMAKNGDLYAALDHNALIKLDWNSKLLWKATDVAAHHEVRIADDGDVYAIAGDLRMADVGGKSRLIEDNYVAVVSPEGQVKKRISFYDLFAKNPDLMKILDERAARTFRRLDREGLDALVKKKASLDKLKTLTSTGKLEGASLYDEFLLTRDVPGIPCDLFHANALVLLKDHPGGLWKDGDILASFRYMSLLVAFDPTDLHVKWWWGPGEVFGQHNPSVLPNGDLLIYDNGTWRPGTGRRGGGGAGKYTRLVELDPVAKKIVWTYEATPRDSFYSPGSGTAQLLPNGDILVGEEDGRAFEIAKDSKETVWEYYNPRFDPTGQRRSGMYRIERLAPEVVEPLLGAGNTPAAAH